MRLNYRRDASVASLKRNLREIANEYRRRNVRATSCAWDCFLFDAPAVIRSFADRLRAKLSA